MEIIIVLDKGIRRGCNSKKMDRDRKEEKEKYT